MRTRSPATRRPFFVSRGICSKRSMRRRFGHEDHGHIRRRGDREHCFAADSGRPPTRAEAVAVGALSEEAALSRPVTVFLPGARSFGPRSYSSSDARSYRSAPRYSSRPSSRHRAYSPSNSSRRYSRRRRCATGLLSRSSRLIARPTLTGGRASTRIHGPHPTARPSSTAGIAPTQMRN